MAAVVGILGYAATRPDSFRVERSSWIAPGTVEPYPTVLLN